MPEASTKPAVRPIRSYRNITDQLNVGERLSLLRDLWGGTQQETKGAVLCFPISVASDAVKCSVRRLAELVGFRERRRQEPRQGPRAAYGRAQGATLQDWPTSTGRWSGAAGPVISCRSRTPVIAIGLRRMPRPRRSTSRPILKTSCSRYLRPGRSGLRYPENHILRLGI
jgi:hypothetical protein